jgi:hypothetical protein
MFKSVSFRHSRFDELSPNGIQNSFVPSLSKDALQRSTPGQMIVIASP